MGVFVGRKAILDLSGKIPWPGAQLPRITFSIPHKFTVTKALFNSLRIVILGLLPTVIRTTFLKLILYIFIYMYVLFLDFSLTARNSLLPMIPLWSITGAWANGKLVLSRWWQELVASQTHHTKSPLCLCAAGTMNTDQFIPLRNHSLIGLWVPKVKATRTLESLPSHPKLKGFYYNRSAHS